jgi:hypothetical protein
MEPEIEAQAAMCLTASPKGTAACGGLKLVSVSEDGFEGGKQRLALLAHSGQVGSEAGEGVSACIAAEAARDFLLDPEPSQVALGLVSVEGARQVVEEGERLVLL